MQKTKLEIIPLATYGNGLNMADALAKAKEKGLDLLINLEVDELLNGKEQRWKDFRDCFPCWTGTHIEYDSGAASCKIWNDGQKPKVLPLPIDGGWKTTDKEYGLPNGAESSRSNKDARYLWRWQDRAGSGLLARGEVEIEAGSVHALGDVLAEADDLLAGS